MVLGKFRQSYFIVIFLLQSYKLHQCKTPTLLSMHVPETFGFSICALFIFIFRLVISILVAFVFNLVNLNLQLEAF